ncbi:MAG TPA: helix-hairpin-helix domain-containing protein [Chthoniobacteraceae bacterium]|jgi:DNA polymerase (family 10)
MAQLNKEQIADVLESIAQLLEIKGELVFKVRAYTNAARALETYSGNLQQMAEEGRLSEIPGVGKAIADKVTELATTGELRYFNELKQEFPETLFELFELQGLGPKKIKLMWDQLGVTSIAELDVALKDGRVAALAGMGKKTAENLRAAIESRSKHAGRFRFGEIAPYAEQLLSDLREHPEVIQVSVAGSYRRRKEVLGDLDFIVATSAPAEVSRFFVEHELVDSLMVQGATKSSVRLKVGIQADLRVVKNGEYPFALSYFTGSKEHNIVMRQRALARGWTLNEYRLEALPPAELAVEAAPLPEGKKPATRRKPKIEAQPIPAIREERELYRALDLDYVEPELREDRGEFAAAEQHTLPDLVELENLRGTFHNHTLASDGRCSLAEMAEGAQELGLQYLGIADHSKSSFQAHGIDEKQLLAQATEIRELNRTFGQEFKLFAGTECDILRDGSLDFPDEILAQLDYAVASIHAVFNLPEAEMTRRIIRAIENPHITMLGHLTGRLLLSRESYPVDVPAVIEAAAATGTIIELNASPRRLDMDWRWWPLAREKGVKCAINPDAHHTSQLQYLWFGVGAARKGWLTRNDVVNCLPLGKIEAVLAAKRSRAP